jgi:large subunit ribosomal protein L4
MKVEVYNSKGESTGRSVDLDDNIFGTTPHEHSIYLDVKYYLAKQRQGTHKAKQRAEIAGSTKKLKKQKGTGTARAGSIKSPLFRGGGRVFGPVPRSYEIKVNKKVRRLARKSALSQQMSNNAITVVEDLNFSEIKTKNYKAFLDSFNATDKKNILVVSELNKNVYLSSRNLKGAMVLTPSELNTYVILNAKQFFISESAISSLTEIC